MEEEDSMKRKKIYGIFMLVAIAVFLFAGGRILQIYLNYQESQKVYEQMEGFTQKIEDQDLSPEAVPGETPEEVAEQGVLQVDFNKLEEINPDVIAWIEIPGLEISYPVVQGRDNDYYLHHLITGENHKSGSIFMDFHNQEDLSDRNTITISGILIFMGLLNYFSTTSTNIIIRQREFSIMRSIGMTQGMLRKMLIYEGIIYVGGVLGLLLIIGSIVMGIVVYILKQNIEYFVFQYPFEGLLCIICIMSFLCVIIPNIFLHKMERNSLIERIKKER